MSIDFERKLAKYAEVLVKVGLNLQEGQRLMIGAPFFGIDGTPIETSPLVREIVRVAYENGARYVAVQWDDEELQRIRVQHASLESLSITAKWKNDVAIEYVENGDATLVIFAQNPDLLEGLDQDKVQAKGAAEGTEFHRLFAPMAAGMNNWLAASAPLTSWASKVLPDLAPEAAKAKLWEVIFEACRINTEDPVTEWRRHLSELAKRSAYLNGKQYASLKYTAPGTDLTVGLPDGHIWQSGELVTKNGLKFVANMPTEEIFTMPHKDRIDGIVTSTKPLSFGGSVINRFQLKLSEGMVVNATAESGQAALDNILNADPNAKSLGEVALVPHSSPISQSNLLFYNALFDENASNHLALGNAYRFSMEGAMEMTAEEFATAGGNESAVHVDFMVGSVEMDVDGIREDGSVEPIMRKGEWAFAV